MNERKGELAHSVMIFIGLGLLVAGIATRTYGAATIGIVIIGANLRKLTKNNLGL